MDEMVLIRKLIEYCVAYQINVSYISLFSSGY